MGEQKKTGNVRSIERAGIDNHSNITVDNNKNNDSNIDNNNQIITITYAPINLKLQLPSPRSFDP